MRKDFAKKVLDLMKEYDDVERVGREFGIGEAMLIRSMETEGYTYNENTNKFELYDITKVIKKDDKSIKKVIKKDNKDIKKVIKKEDKSIKKIIESDDKSIIEVSEINDNNNISSHQIFSDNISQFSNDEVNMIKVLLNSYDDIINLIKTKPIVLDLPTKKDIRTTVNVNEKVWEEFNKKCDKLRYYDKKDLLSLALQDFIKKY